MVEADVCTRYLCEHKPVTTTEAPPPTTPSPEPHTNYVPVIVCGLGILCFFGSTVFLIVYISCNKPVTGQPLPRREAPHIDDDDYRLPFNFPEGTPILRRNGRIFEWIPLTELGIVRSGLLNPSRFRNI